MIPRKTILLRLFPLYMRWSVLAIGLFLSLSSFNVLADFSIDDVRPLHYSNGQAQSRPVQGLRAALNASPEYPVRVLIVHGMMTNESGYSQDLQSNTATSLGLYYSEASSQNITLERGYEFTLFAGPQPIRLFKPASSILVKTSWATDAKNQPRLVFYELLWAPLRDQIKHTYLSCFESRSLPKSVRCPRIQSKPNSDVRDVANGSLKDHVMVEGFADAMLVTGAAGNVFRDDVQLSICLLARDILNDRGLIPAQTSSDRHARCNVGEDFSTQDQLQNAGIALGKSPFIVITHSLGSFLFQDAQHHFAMNRPRPGSGPTARNEETLLFNLTDHATVFMLANQTSLLSLARLKASCENTLCQNRLLDSLDTEITAELSLMQMTTYVAFNDVNDLLGFELPWYLPDVGLDGNLFNVSVRNSGFRIPWLFKSPLAAHTHHWTNSTVRNLIVNGFNPPTQ